MTPARSAFLALLRARAAQRCPGPCDHRVDFEGGFVEVGCTRCAARLRLPLRRPDRPAPEPPIRENHMRRVMQAILVAAWDRWRERFTSAGWRGYGFEHVPLEVDVEAVTERAA